MMRFRKNYDKERANKVDNRTHIIGNPVTLFLLWLIWSYFVSWISAYFTIGFSTLLAWLNSPNSQQALHDGQLINFEPVMEVWKNTTNFGNYQLAITTNKLLFFGLTIIFSLVMIPIFGKLYYKHRSTNFNQYGNDRFATVSEVLRQYPQIPDKGYEFSGTGGIPVMHIKPTNPTFIRIHPILFFKYWLLPIIPWTIAKIPLFSINQKDWLQTFEPAKGFYSIDTTKTSSMIVGISRSGKGETLVMPLIDILSRAKNKVSMVVNDLKGELNRMSYYTLKERGYDVKVINLDELNFSDSYNPLEIIIKYAKEGYYDKAQKAANVFSSSIYTDPNAKDKFWQNSSINLLNALILAVLDYADRNNRWDQVTMDNVLHMMTDLGGKEVMVDQDNNIVSNPQRGQQVSMKSKLTVYFSKLRDLNDVEYSEFRQMALDSFAQSKFAGEETSGNIYSSAMEGIKLYQQSDIAKMTSLNSLNLESIGFPRVFKAKFSDKFKFSTAIISFSNDKSVIEEKTVIVDELGNISCPIKSKLPDSFEIKISFAFRKNKVELKDKYVVMKTKKIYRKKAIGKGSYVLDPYTKKPILKTVRLKVTKIALGKEGKEKSKVLESSLAYSEKPVALFFVTPPNNPAYNQLATFAIDQVFNVNYELASANEEETVIPIHYILDEFGNLNTIPNLDTKVTMGLGSRIHFHFVVQNLEQLELHYSKQQAATIQSNCANLLYILTNSETTAKFISGQIGKRTVEVNTKNGKALNPHAVNYSGSLVGQDLLSPTELTRLMGGEMVVLRSVYRQDTKGRSVSAYPIFDHAATKMPYRYTFLNQEFNSSTKLSDVAIKSRHRSLDLKAQRINYDTAYTEIIKMIGKNLRSKSATGQTAIQEILNNQIFSDTELENRVLISKITNYLYSLASRIAPQKIESFKDVNFFWKRNNSWNAIKEILEDDIAFESFKNFVTNTKKEVR